MFSQGFKSASSYLGHSAFLYYYEYKKIFVMGFLFLGFRKYEYETNDFPLKHNLIIFHLKGEVSKAPVLSTFLYGCEVWCLREDLFNRLRSFRYVRSMCRVSLRHAFHHNISSATLFQRLNVMDLDSCYHNQILRWAGHVARMPMIFRAPRQLLTGWVAHSRPNGCPEMTWGRTLKKALKCKGLPANFKE